MTGIEPGETRTPRPDGGARRLSEPPSARYAGADGTSAVARSALRGPFARAVIVGIAGAAALVGVAAFIGSSLGLVFVAGASGTAVGLVLARAAAPRDDARAVSRRSITLLAVATVVASVALADVATWLYALGEGGTLGLIDYLFTTFGAVIPGVAIVAGLTAAWGANAGPVQG